MAVSMPHALAAAGWVALRRGRSEEALSRAAEAVRVGQAHQDRPAVAEALLLQAAAEDRGSAATAEEARRIWQDLGSPIGEARAALLIAETSSGREREHLVAEAEQRLFDAGALGHLADARRARSNGSPIAITTLGGFRVSRDGTPIDVGDWGSRKARDLLKLLVARRGAPVVRDEAATLLWPDEPDRSSRRLSVLLSTIRSTLDPRKSWPADHYVAADHDTVWLVREHVDVDVELFLREDGGGAPAARDRRTGEGRDAARPGDGPLPRRVLRRRSVRRLDRRAARARPAHVRRGGLRARRARRRARRPRRGGPPPVADHRRRSLRRGRPPRLDPLPVRPAPPRRGAAGAYRTYCARLAELDVDPAPFPD